MAQSNLAADAEVVRIQPEVGKLTGFAKSLVIKTAAGYEQAASYLKTIKGMLATIEDARTRVTKPLNESLREVNKQAKEASEPLQTAEQQIKRAMISFQDEQERLRQEQQRKAEEAARKERERIQAQQREAEAKARAEQQRLQVEAERAAAEGRAAEAAKLAAKAVSVQQKAEAKCLTLEDQAAMVVAPVIQQEAPKVSGITSREVWKYEVTDPALLPREYTLPDEKKIGGVVRAMKGDTKIPGVRVWRDTGIAAGSR